VYTHTSVIFFNIRDIYPCETPVNSVISLCVLPLFLSSIAILCFVCLRFLRCLLYFSIDPIPSLCLLLLIYSACCFLAISALRKVFICICSASVMFNFLITLLVLYGFFIPSFALQTTL